MLEKQFDKYRSDILKIISFIKSNFGEGDYLIKKSQGLIPKKEYGLKNEFQITGYSFHGFGCGFQFKNYQVDVEFLDGNVGFTSWSFYSYLKRKNEPVAEKEVTTFLNSLIREDKLVSLGDLYLIKW